MPSPFQSGPTRLTRVRLLVSVESGVDHAIPGALDRTGYSRARRVEQHPLVILQWRIACHGAIAGDADADAAVARGTVARRRIRRFAGCCQHPLVANHCANGVTFRAGGSAWTVRNHETLPPYCGALVVGSRKAVGRVPAGAAAGLTSSGQYELPIVMPAENRLC